MNSQEREQLNQLLKQLGEVTLTTKDAEAEAMIREAAARQPDATYLLVQRALLLEQAVTGAKVRIDELQRQLQSSQSEQKNGFLSNNSWAQPAINAVQVTGAANDQTTRYAQQQQPQQVAASGFGGGSNFLGNIATTAAGVVAGSFLFQGIENLMGHHSSGFEQQPSGEQFTEQTVINNYYGDDAGQQAANNDDDRNNYLAV
jgi:hypothetical protein